MTTLLRAIVAAILLCAMSRLMPAIALGAAALSVNALPNRSTAITARQSASPSPSQPAGALLPTAALAREVRALQDWTDVDGPRPRGYQLRKRISVFIVDQLNAMPSISSSQLRAQLRAIVPACLPSEVCGESRPPYVFKPAWGPKVEHIQVVVAYVIETGTAAGPGITVLENYVWEKDRGTRRTARGGSEFDAYGIYLEQVMWWPQDNEYWVLVWGTLRGASGRGLSGRAAVYRVAVDGVSIVSLRSSKMVNVVAQKNDIGWEVNYDDPERLYGGLPNARVLDVYKLGFTSRTHQRVVHYTYSPE
jgi:hypothetical protein